MEGRTSGPLDVGIGRRIRQRRMFMGISQQKLADALGLTFQQVQKYETGRNRVSASRLLEMSQILDVPITFFFEGLTDTEVDGQAHSPFDGLDRAETLKLVRAYWSIPDEAVRRAVFGFVKSLAKGGGTDAPS